MEQKQKDVIINTVNDIGIIETINLFAGDKDIIRNAYIDNPERYMDYLIGNLLKEHKPITDEIYFYKPIVIGGYNNYEVIFECKRPDYEFKLNGNLYVCRGIWNYFYVNFMGFTTKEIENIIKSWITKNIPDLSSLTPVCKQPNLSFSASTMGYRDSTINFEDEYMVLPSNHRI